MPGIDASARSDSRACEIFTNLKQNIDIDEEIIENIDIDIDFRILFTFFTICFAIYEILKFMTIFVT